MSTSPIHLAHHDDLRLEVREPVAGVTTAEGRLGVVRLGWRYKDLPEEQGQRTTWTDAVVIFGGVDRHRVPIGSPQLPTVLGLYVDREQAAWLCRAVCEAGEAERAAHGRPDNGRGGPGVSSAHTGSHISVSLAGSDLAAELAAQFAEWA
jgi:hypothetical protein